MRALYLISIFLWIIASWYLCKTTYTCAPDEPTVSESAVGAAAVPDEGCITDIEFEDGDFLVSSTENFRFTVSEESPLNPSEDFLGILTNVKTYLSENPDRFMRLTGYYMDGEENATDQDDLGMARALNVKEYLKEFGFDGIQLNTHSEMLASGCVNDDVLQKGISVRFGEIK